MRFASQPWREEEAVAGTEWQHRWHLMCSWPRCSGNMSLASSSSEEWGLVLPDGPEAKSWMLETTVPQCWHLVGSKQAIDGCLGCIPGRVQTNTSNLSFLFSADIFKRNQICLVEKVIWNIWPICVYVAFISEKKMPSVLDLEFSSKRVCSLGFH